MDNPGNPLNPLQIRSLTLQDMQIIEQVREVLVNRGITPPGWRDSDPEHKQRFYDEIRSILLSQPGLSRHTDGMEQQNASVNEQAQIIADALSGIGLLDQLLRDPYVEEIFVRNGEVAVEYDGTFYHLGKAAEDQYFENLAIHVADQGGATLRGDRPTVLIDLPGGERFTAILPRLSTEGTAINIRTFGRRIRTLKQMEQDGTFTKQVSEQIPIKNIFEVKGQIGEDVLDLQEPADRFLAWLANSLSASLMIAGEMGSGKTTLLNALSAYIPEKAPIATLETFQELEIQHPFLLSVVAPAELPKGTPGVTLDWVLNVIYTRMNPAAILVGEVVGNEALQFLKATCLGRKAFTTIHGGTVEEALMRLEQLALAAVPELGLQAIRSMIVSGVNVIALMKRHSEKERAQRKLQAIALVKGLDEQGNYLLEYLYQLENESTPSLLKEKYTAMEMNR
jgi:pilus assembly protein CpaF